MIITHKLKWDKCLSHKIFPLIEKGWQDEDRPIHFFWGLAGQNRKEIAQCVEKKEEWIAGVKSELTQHTKRDIIVRNKPRPGNEWWGTDIREQLKDCHCLVTNMSIASVDAILNRVPVITDGRNVSWAVASRDPKYVERPFRPGKKTVLEWLKFITEQQFTLDEIEDGTAYKLLNQQGVI